MLSASGEGEALELEERLLRWDETALPPGYRIGPYKLVRPMARGGMGEVYLGERTDGSYRQRVAVKLLRPGLEATGMLDRFRLERDVLARLSHPSVVPLLDGGATAEGRPYLVLQYVEGLPITEHCDRRGLGRRQRLRLFVELCRAVQYAHSHLIVHRDLKPSNVLVDETGGIRLLDFGIAKLLAGHPADDATRAAETAPMTPGRAAPEQLRGEPVTTATDVWALGLLVGELLTGRPPGEHRVDGQAPPSPALDRDLAAIAGRAVRERPEERYATAGELADDVERWLDGKPVRARPDSAAYRVRRFVGRHRAAVAAAAAAVAALAALAAVSTIQSARAIRAGERAAAEERKARAVVDLLLETFGATDPHAGAGEKVSIDVLLDQGEERAAGLADQPEVQAALRHALGRIRLERGDFERARELLAAARDAEVARLGADHPEAVPVRINYARSLHANGLQQEAERELRAGLAALDAVPDHDPRVEVAALMGLASVVHGSEGVRALERAVELMRPFRTTEPVDYADALNALALVRNLGGDAAAARALYEESLPLYAGALGPEAARTLTVRSHLASLLEAPAARVAAHREVLELRRRRFGDDSRPAANSWNHLGLALTDAGALEEAADAFRRAEEIWTRIGGAGNPMAVRALHNLARNLALRARYDEADRAYARLEELLGGDPRSESIAAAARAERAELRARRAGAPAGPPAPAPDSAHG